eukprot:4347658-Alexandrium_andersonii.AAC.1
MRCLSRATAAPSMPTTAKLSQYVMTAVLPASREGAGRWSRMSFSGPHCKASSTMNWCTRWASQNAHDQPIGTTRKWNQTGCEGSRSSRPEKPDSEAPAATAVLRSWRASAKLMGGKQKNRARGPSRPRE